MRLVPIFLLVLFVSSLDAQMMRRRVLGSSGPLSQTRSPTTAVSDGSGEFAWTTPGNVTALDGNYAHYDGITSSLTSDGLKCTGYGFSIPEGSTIDSIKVEWLVQDYSAAAVGMDEMALVVAGVTQTTVSAIPTMPTTLEYISACNDIIWWNLFSLSASDVNSSGFGSSLTIFTADESSALRTDYNRMTVYYH